MRFLELFRGKSCKRILELEQRIKGLEWAILEADECALCYEGVGLLYWMEKCQEQGTSKYEIIKEVLAKYK